MCSLSYLFSHAARLICLPRLHRVTQPGHRASAGIARAVTSRRLLSLPSLLGFCNPTAYRLDPFPPFPVFFPLTAAGGC